VETLEGNGGFEQEKGNSKNDTDWREKQRANLIKRKHLLKRAW